MLRSYGIHVLFRFHRKVALHDDDVVDKVIENRENVMLKHGAAPERVVVVEVKEGEGMLRCKNYGWYDSGYPRLSFFLISSQRTGVAFTHLYPPKCRLNSNF